MIRTRLAILGLECNEQGIILHCFKVLDVALFMDTSLCQSLDMKKKTTTFMEVNNGPSEKGKQVVVLAMENTKQM